MQDSVLRALVDLRDRQIQKARIQFGNRLSAMERGDDSAPSAQQRMVEKWMCRFEELEKELDKDIAAAVKDHPIYEQMSCVRGVGPLLAAKVIAMIDITRCDTVSALWRYAGYGVLDGERERPRKGEPLHYNVRLKTTLYLIAGSFLKTGSPYRRVYDSAKAYYEANRSDWTKAHIHAAAMRKMIKHFLTHTWLRWRELEGLGTRPLYVEERLGHTHIDKPEEFGWPA